MSPQALFRYFREGILQYALKFGVVGVVGIATDVGVFNLLRLGILGHGHLLSDPIGAKIASATIWTLST